MRRRSLLATIALSIGLHASAVILAGLEWPSSFVAPAVDDAPADVAGVWEDEEPMPAAEAAEDVGPVAVAVLLGEPEAPPAPAAPTAEEVAAAEAAKAARAERRREAAERKAEAARQEALAKAEAERAEAEAAERARLEEERQQRIAERRAAREERRAARQAQDALATARRGAQARSAGPECEPAPETIAQVDDLTWELERELVEFYATHLNELFKQGSVWTHKDARGKPDGFKVGLTRCSIVKHAGLRSGDVVNSINDRRISTIPQAVAAYFDLRNEETLELHVTRGGKPVVLTYYMEQPDRAEKRELRKATRKEMRGDLRDRKG